MAKVGDAREKAFNRYSVLTATDKEVTYREFDLLYSEHPPLELDVKRLMVTFFTEAHPSAWTIGAYADSTAAYQSALLQLSRIITAWTGIKISSKRLVVVNVGRCLVTEQYFVIVYEPIRRVLKNGSIQRHMYKYRLTFSAK